MQAFMIFQTVIVKMRNIIVFIEISQLSEIGIVDALEKNYYRINNATSNSEFSENLKLVYVYIDDDKLLLLMDMAPISHYFHIWSKRADLFNLNTLPLT